jgi:TolB-like protein
MIVTLQKLLQKAMQVSDPRDLHALALDLIESMLRHYAVVSIAAYRHAGARDPKVNRILSEQLPRPSMGSWKNFLQLLVHADSNLFPEQFWEKFLQPLSKKTSLPDITTAYAGLRRLADQDVFSSHESPAHAEPAPCSPMEFLNAAVAYRNRFAGHGTHALPEAAAQFAPVFLKGTAALCTHLNSLWLACPVYVAKQDKLYGRTFFRLIPLVEAEGVNELQTVSPGVEEDRLYICFGEKKHPEAESLYPIVLWEEDDILFANGSQDLKEVRYIGYVNQKSIETVIYDEDFRAFLKPITSIRNPEQPSSVPQPSEKSARDTIRTYRLVAVSIVGALILVATFAGYWYFIHNTGLFSPKSEGKKITSIAVLPLKNLSSGPEQEGFAYEMREILITNISKIRGLNVVPTTNMKTEKINVDAFIDGSVFRFGNDVRISVKLIRAQTGILIWADDYEMKIEDVFIQQGRIAEVIAREIHAETTPEDKQRLAESYKVNPAAFDAYIKGLNSLEKGYDEWGNALENVQQAVKIDPNFALGYTGVARVYNYMGYHYWVKYHLPPKEAYPLARKAAEKALELNENLAEAYTQLAWTNLYYDWNMAEAEKNLNRALTFNPGYALARQYHRDYLMILGRWDEAIEELRRAQEIEPNNGTIAYLLSISFIHAGKYEDASREAEKVVKMAPGPGSPLYQLAYSYYYSGKFEESLRIISELEKAGSKSIHVQSLHALILMKLGKQGEGRKIFAELLKKVNPNISQTFIAEIYMYMGDYDKTFEWLEKAYDERNSWLVYIKSFPEWTPIRSDPRYVELLKKMGMAD